MYVIVASLLCAHVIVRLVVFVVVVVVFKGLAVTVNVLPVRNVLVVRVRRLYLLAPQLETASCLLDLVFLQSVLVSLFFVFVIIIHITF